MSSAVAIAKRAGWMTSPSTWGGLVGAVLASIYAGLTLPLPPNRKVHFFVCAAIAALISTVVGAMREQRSIATFRSLADPATKVTSERLSTALGEVHGFPMVTFWVNLFGWTGGCFILALVYYAFPDVPMALLVRISLLGIAMGPITAILVHLLVLERSRTIQGELISLIDSPQDVVRTLPPARQGIRRRLLVFTAVAVLTPSILILDVTLTRTVRTLEQTLSITDPAVQLAQLQAQQLSTDLTSWALAALIVVLVLAMAWLGGSSLARPLTQLAAEADRAAGGDLSRVSIIPAEDELWAVSSAFALLQIQIKDTLGELSQAGERLLATTRELAGTSGRQEVGVAEQSAGLTETSATTEELARSAEQIAGNASQVATTADLTLAAARAGETGAHQFLSSMRRLKDENQVIAEAVLRLNKRVQQIGKVVEFISEIADKTDLLALNAELEGTKAGEVGRGFSLVAAEMRRLAENVLKSTGAITRLIEEIRDATNSAVMATEAGVKTTEAGATLAMALTENLGRILELAQRTSEASKSISLATQQQRLGTEELARAMTEILRVTEGNSEATREMVSANAGLAMLSSELREVVQQVRTR